MAHDRKIADPDPAHATTFTLPRYAEVRALSAAGLADCAPMDPAGIVSNLLSIRGPDQVLDFGLARVCSRPRRQRRRSSPRCAPLPRRSAERLVGYEWVSTGRSWVPRGSSKKK